MADITASAVETLNAVDSSTARITATQAEQVEELVAQDFSTASNVTSAHTSETIFPVDRSVAIVTGPLTTSMTIVMTNINGTFPTGKVKIGGTVVGTCVGPQSINGGSTAKLRAEYANLAADVQRSLIDPVPGSGHVLGVWLYNDVVYAFRNHADGQSAIMYRSSIGGWQYVDLGFEVAFNSGGNDVLVAGDIIIGNTSNAVATLTGVVLERGTWASGSAEGRFIFASSVGTFLSGETVAFAGHPNAATIFSMTTPITLLPNGRYEFGNFNFAGSSTSLKMYGVDGVNRGFEFDGTAYIPIQTGMFPDTPLHLTAFKQHLFYSYGSSVQHSGIGTPLTWTVITGAAELAMSDDVTGFMPQPGGETTSALAIFSRNSIKILYGAASTSWNLVSFKIEIGAVPYTIQQVSKTIMLDDRGLTNLETSQNYGNFADAVLSKLIQSFLVLRRSRSVASSVCRDKNQYRLYFNDGSGLYATTDNGQMIGILPVLYPDILSCVCSLENLVGEEEMYFGSNNGFVYRQDVGTSFDGLPIDFHMSLAFTNSKSPRVIKSYRNAVIEASGLGYSEFALGFDLAYSTTEMNQFPAQPGIVSLSPVLWDSGIFWDSGAVYDGVSLIPVQFELGGDAENISIYIQGSGDHFSPVRFSGVLIHYTTRRLIR